MDTLHDVLMGSMPLIAVFGCSGIGSAVACFTCKMHDRKLAKQRAQAKAKAARVRAAKRARLAKLEQQRQWRADWDAYFASEVALMASEQK
jgi:hypothetical protein